MSDMEGQRDNWVQGKIHDSSGQGFAWITRIVVVLEGALTDAWNAGARWVGWQEEMAKKHVAELKAFINSVQDQNERLKEKVQTLELETDNLRTQAALLLDQRGSSAEEMTDLRTGLRENMRKLKAAEAEVASLKALLEECSDTNDGFQAEVTDKNRYIHDLEIALDKKRAECARLIDLRRQSAESGVAAQEKLAWCREEWRKREQDLADALRHANGEAAKFRQETLDAEAREDAKTEEIMRLKEKVASTEAALVNEQVARQGCAPHAIAAHKKIQILEREAVERQTKMARLEKKLEAASETAQNFQSLYLKTLRKLWEAHKEKPHFSLPTGQPSEARDE